MSVAGAGTLGGTGTVNGAVTVDGSIAPGPASGTGIGTLTVNNNVTWNSGVNWKFNLAATGTSSDLLNITGTGSDFDKGSGATGTFIFDFMDSTPEWNKTFTLVRWADTTDFVLDDFDYTNLGGGRTGTFTLDTTNRTLSFTAIPEPRSALLGGLATLLLLRRRRALHA